MMPEPTPRDRLAGFFHPLVESSQGFMCVHDLDGNLLFVNTAAASALGSATSATAHLQVA